jgi:hypothetical protein
MAQETPTGRGSTRASGTRNRFRGAVAALVLALAASLVVPAVASARRVQPPQTVILTGPPSRTASTTIAFSFSGLAHRRVQVMRFSWRLDRGRWSRFTRATSVVLHRLRRGRHVFRVRVQDGARRTDRTPAAAVFVVDRTPPVTHFTSTPAKIAGSAAAAFAFASSERGSTFQCSHDGSAAAPCASPVAVIVRANGPHRFAVLATDVAGNRERRAVTYTWTVADSTPPDSVVDAAPSASGSSSAVELRFHSTEAGSTFRCRLDGAAAVACASPVVYASLALGAHSFSVTAVDPVGNADPTPATRAFTVTSAPPDTTITSGPSGTVTTSSATFAFTASNVAKPPVTFDCSLDGAAFAACTSPRTLSLLANASHTFRVRAKDKAGNIDPTPATRTWTVAVPRTWKILVADNLGKRILITDFTGHIVWKCSNPLGDDKTYSGPLGVRWMANGHILATFGTGYVAEIDPSKPCPGFPGVASPPTPPEIVWRYNGPASDGFQSPYDAVVLPDGSLAVALRFNNGGKVAVYKRSTGQNLWQLLLGDAHSLEYLPGGPGSSYPAGPTFLMGGHGAVEQVTYDSAKTVVWFYNNGGSFGHRIIEDSDHNIVAAEGYYFHKLRRSDHKELWRIQLVEGTAPNQVQVQWRGVAEDPVSGNYVASDLTDNTIDIVQRNTGTILSHFGVFNIGDGGPYSFMKFPYGLRVIQYP